MKKITNDMNIDIVMATWLASNTYTGNRKGKSISATTLLRSTQQQVLGFRQNNSNDIDEIVDISTLLKSAIGTAIHKAIQDTWENEDLRAQALSSLGLNLDTIAKFKVNPEDLNKKNINLVFEKRVDREFMGWNITGQFDLVFNGDVHDFKSTSTYTYVNKTKEKDYILQGSIYRWLNPELITGDFITVHYIFTDWNKNYALSNPDYPKHPFVSIELPLMSLEETEDYIRTEIQNIESYIDKPALPPCDAKTLMLDEVWQYFSSNTATRASKNFSSELEANKYLAEKGKGYVAKKPTEPKGCNYCNCRCSCKQYQSFVNAGLIHKD